MAQARPFSIFLLKDGHSEPVDALKADHELVAATTNDRGLGEPWPIFLTPSRSSTPWWRDYFSISDPVTRGYAGALVFVKASKRTFALTFGQTRHSLRDEAYEYDFGLRTTLNAVDPEEIRNTDELDPATARRRRTQLPERSDISYFDFDGDSAVLRSLTGAIRPEYKNLFSHATGASNLRVSTKKSSAELIDLLDKLYDVYERVTYLDAFPAANNIQPVKDPTAQALLDEKLLSAFRSKNDHLLLTIPELVDFQEDFEVLYTGRGTSGLHSDATIRDYFGYLARHGADVAKIDIEALRRDRLTVMTADGATKGNYSIYRCLVFETSLEESSEAFHLSEGTWYRVDADYLSRLKTDLDPYFVDASLPARTEHSEFDYNRKQLVPHWRGSVLLDRSNTSPPGQKQVEPCDVARVEDDHLILTHVKLGVSASDLSHLFNQGTNAVDLLNGVPAARSILRELIAERDPGFNLTPLDSQDLKVEYVVVTKNDVMLASDALPLFSRISLRRACRALSSMRTEVLVYLAEDKYVGEAREKPRKKKASDKHSPTAV